MLEQAVLWILDTLRNNGLHVSRALFIELVMLVVNCIRIKLVTFLLFVEG